MFRITGKTHPGAVRDHNEDALYCDESEGLAVVADGMGGYAAGEVASAIIVDTVAELKPAADKLVATLVESHNRILAHARDNPESKGMGSAVVLARLAPDKVNVCWAGDSRAYLFGGDKTLKAVSRDHSYVQWLLSQGQITEAQARTHPERNLVTQCLGLQPPQPELTTVGWSRGDILLLCSDGLSDELTDGRIAELLRESVDAETAVKRLVDAALKAGGKDNITVILAENLSRLKASSTTSKGQSGAASKAPQSSKQTRPTIASHSQKNRGTARASWLPVLLGVVAASALAAIAIGFFLLK